MNYQATPNDYPSDAEIDDLVDYVSGELKTITESGSPATDGDITGFKRCGKDRDLSYMHTFSFANEYRGDELAERVRHATRKCREGQVLIGVHEGVYGNNHVHVAEVGSRERVAMDVDDIVDYREAVCDRFSDEQIGGT